MRYLLDTNAINAALDQLVPAAQLQSIGELHVTHVQVNELRATKRTERLDGLLRVLEAIKPETVPTEAAAWDVSEWGEAKWGDGNGVLKLLSEGLKRRNGGKPNNTHDTLIGVTAIVQKMVLVTDDGDLAAAVGELGGEVISFKTLLERSSIAELKSRKTL